MKLTHTAPLRSRDLASNATQSSTYFLLRVLNREEMHVHGQSGTSTAVRDVSHCKLLSPAEEDSQAAVRSDDSRGSAVDMATGYALDDPESEFQCQ
jgi:hypothetical protein